MSTCQIVSPDFPALTMAEYSGPKESLTFLNKKTPSVLNMLVFKDRKYLLKLKVSYSIKMYRQQLPLVGHIWCKFNSEKVVYRLQSQPLNPINYSYREYREYIEKG